MTDKLCIFFLSPLLALFAAVEKVEADTFEVNTTSTLVNGGDGLISLPEAFALANAEAGADVITFSDQVFGGIELDQMLNVYSDLTIDASDRNLPMAIEVSEDNSFYINSSSLSLSNINISVAEETNTDDAVFALTNGASLSFNQVNLQSASDNSYMRGISAANSNIDIVYSTLTGFRSTGKGAAIYLQTNGVNHLSISESTFSSNQAFASGGAVVNAQLNDGGSLDVELVNTSFVNNQAAYDGGVFNFDLNGAQQSLTLSADASQFSFNSSGEDGAVLAVQAFAESTVDITFSQSLISNNTAASDAGVISMGLDGEAAGYIDAVLTLDNSTVSANRAGGSGATLKVSSDYMSAADRTDINIINSTLYGNEAGLKGNALFITSDSGSGNLFVDLVNSTFSDNHAQAGGGALYIQTDYVSAGLTSIALHNTVIANSSSLDLTDVVIAADNDLLLSEEISEYASFSVSTSLVENIVITDANILGAGLIAGVDPLLGALSDNGGEQLTMLPGEESLLIDAGNNNFAVDANDLSLSLDQRGMARIQNEVVDIGAVEVEFIATDELSETKPREKSGGLAGTISFYYLSVLGLFSGGLSLSRKSGRANDKKYR